MKKADILKIIRTEIERIDAEAYEDVQNTVQSMIPEYQNGKVYNVKDLSNLVIAEITTYGDIPMQHRTKMLGIDEARVLKYQKHYKKNEYKVLENEIIEALSQAFENLKKKGLS